MSSKVEHVNVTVSDPRRTAELMEKIFGWRIRWEGPSQMGGYTIHVGDDACYLAVWSPGAQRRYPKGQPLNHIGVEVDDLDACEARVVAAGLEPFAHGD